jgi:hypothetical protein
MLDEILGLFAHDYIIEAYGKLVEYESTLEDHTELNTVP